MVQVWSHLMPIPLHISRRSYRERLDGKVPKRLTESEISPAYCCSYAVAPISVATSFCLPVLTFGMTLLQAGETGTSHATKRNQKCRGRENVPGPQWSSRVKCPLCLLSLMPQTLFGDFTSLAFFTLPENLCSQVNGLIQSKMIFQFLISIERINHL